MLLPRFRGALRLSPSELARVVEAVVLFHGFRVALRVVSGARLVRWLGARGPQDTPPEALPSGVVEVRRALRRASRRHANTCLAQALAGRVMLRRRGLPSTLSLGARKEGERLAFHAWLRAGGLLLNPGGGPRDYAVLATFHDAPRLDDRATEAG
ncbi:lasso peptide biosynthesis B2 protein [Rubrivirga marina]|uniref:Microcin J25-processing protein McjB C-terminal domain-containing protein n=1 Tax=Rubrivirga marina TaxID=1196024 RepID=A0A271IYT9_9BACT|nr:lasso peptide biosynthesis B2 protein [Rubrivirga marina]PAP75865.1 hypothetical protein BSZ37_05115 [Rubrivirga marina]